MEQSGVVGLSISRDAQRVTDFRDAPFCAGSAPGHGANHRRRGARLDRKPCPAD